MTPILHFTIRYYYKQNVMVDGVTNSLFFFAYVNIGKRTLLKQRGPMILHTCYNFENALAGHAFKRTYVYDKVERVLKYNVSAAQFSF